MFGSTSFILAGTPKIYFPYMYVIVKQGHSEVKMPIQISFTVK